MSRGLAWLAGALLAAGPGAARAGADEAGAAFARDVAALQARGPCAPSPADSALRLRIVREALALEPRPQPPPAARARFEHARRAARRCSCRDSTLYAVDELTRALQEAPWWGEAHRHLGVALQRLVRNAEAGVCLELYLAAEPGAPGRDRLERQAAKLLGRKRAAR